MEKQGDERIIRALPVLTWCDKFTTAVQWKILFLLSIRNMVACIAEIWGLNLVIGSLLTLWGSINPFIFSTEIKYCKKLTTNGCVFLLPFFLLAYYKRRYVE